MSSNELRKKFLEFFKARGHVVLPSGSLVPVDDPTTLFTGSGMQPLVPYLLGKPHPQGKRLANSQKSFRAADMEEVGDFQHTTFFEMLGNWSLGDYFKKEQIPWMFEFLTKELILDPGRLYITCFRGNSKLGIPKDEESARLWQELFEKSGIDAAIADFPENKGLQGARIFYYDETKNWWSRFGSPQDMPVGEPGGPDSEVFWDFGKDLELHEKSAYKDQVCHVNCQCGRFLEIGNNVFMEYVKTLSGFDKIAQQNVDFGGGLERMKAALDNNPDVFEIDLFELPRKALEELLGREYGKEASEMRAFRIILDHMRASVFLIADGVQPSNVERGYILRRLLRRASRYAHLLKLRHAWYDPIIQAIIKTYGQFYPEVNKLEEIRMTVANEYEKFEKALEKGLKEFEKIALRGAVSSREAFHLYQSYGFPIEMIEELGKERGIEVDLSAVEEEFRKHQEISRAGEEQKFGGHGLAGMSDEEVRKDPAIWQMTKLHSATHLLHQALRDVLGKEVKQMGSDITPERTRFDFSFGRKLREEELKRIEGIVNQKINENLPVKREIMPYKEALIQGALAFFKEKYPEEVSVYSIGNYSRELCGGPHVKQTSEIGKFRILKEEAVSQGVRRIRAVVQPRPF
jgi:alanyl-tRNA synthetase